MTKPLPREGELCPAYPGCGCICQGYLNLVEPNNCGRKPKSRLIVHPASDTDDIVSFFFGDN